MNPVLGKSRALIKVVNKVKMFRTQFLIHFVGGQEARVTSYQYKNYTHKEIDKSTIWKNRLNHEITDFQGEKQTILAIFFPKSVLYRPSSVKTDHIARTGTPVISN